MGTYTIKSLDDADIQNLKSNWIPAAEANDDLPVSSFVRAVSWAGDVVSGSASTEAEIMGVVCERGQIHAIFDRVGVRPHLPRGYFKILSLVVAPHLDLSGISRDQIFTVRDQFAEVVAEVIAHGITLLNEHESADRVKFFASDRVTLALFQKIWGSFEAETLEALELATNAYGNWAEFSRA